MLQSELDIFSEDEKIINNRLKQITGGNLKWGLSAAGFLDPDTFLFLQSATTGAVHVNLKGFIDLNLCSCFIKFTKKFHLRRL